MAIVPIHTSLVRLPQFVPLSDTAFRLWLYGALWCQEQVSDGCLPKSVVRTLRVNHRPQVIAQLLTVQPGCRSPLWHDEGDHYRYDDWLNWGNTKAEVQHSRLLTRERVRRHRMLAEKTQPGGNADVTPLHDIRTDECNAVTCNAVTRYSQRYSVTKREKESKTKKERELKKDTPYLKTDTPCLEPSPAGEARVVQNDGSTLNCTTPILGMTEGISFLNAPKKAKPSDPRIRLFLEWWQVEYPKHNDGAVYLVRWAKETAAVKGLLAAYSLEHLQELAIGLWETDEPFISATDRGIGVLVAKANWLELKYCSTHKRHAKES